MLWDLKCLSKPIIDSLFFRIFFCKWHGLRHNVPILFIQYTILFSLLIPFFVSLQQSCLILLLLFVFLDCSIRNIIILFMQSGAKCFLDSHSHTFLRVTGSLFALIVENIAIIDLRMNFNLWGCCRLSEWECFNCRIQYAYLINSAEDLLFSGVIVLINLWSLFRR